MAACLNNSNASAETINVLNIDKEKSTISANGLLNEANGSNHNTFVTSDVDEQLLIFVQFKHIVHLKSMKIYSLTVDNDITDIDASGPKEVHIFKVNDLNLNFGDFDDAKISHSHKSITCKQKKLQHGQNISFTKKTEFLKLQYLAIYIVSNLHGTECTNINAITFSYSVDTNNIKRTFQTPQTKCHHCSSHYTKPIINPLHDNQVIVAIMHNKPDPHNKSVPDIHSFSWRFKDDQVQRFKDAEVAEVTFRSDYHVIDGNLLYFEITPNGWVDKANPSYGYVPPGNACIWLALHQSDKKFVKIRFQYVSEDIYFIGEKDEMLTPNVQHTSNCTESSVGTWLTSPDNAMKLFKFKHLNTISFLCNVSINPTTFKKELVDPTDDQKSSKSLEEHKENKESNEEFRKTLSQRKSQQNKPLIDNDIQSKESNEELLCDENVKMCPSVGRLIQVLNKFETASISESDVLFEYSCCSIVDLFAHSLLVHAANDEFEYIMKAGNKCDIKQCDKFQRNYRDRNVPRSLDKNEQNLNIYECVKRDIVDTVHCYFKHSIDTGHKLSAKQRDELNDFVNEEKKSDLDFPSFHNRTFLKLRQFALRKDKYDIFRPHKFSKFILKQQNIQFRQESQDMPSTEATNNVYSYGQKFYYRKKEKGWNNVLPRYKSLKQEMIYNPNACMDCEQFNREYHKASVHMNSYHRKTFYPTITKEQIFALLIYCAFTSIQYEFSKTYRDNIHHHNQFCHFGFALSTAINEHGTTPAAGAAESFYHGLDGEFSFPYVTGPKLGTQINSPLSTTTEFAVASNFATARGLIIEVRGASFLLTAGKTKYFPVSWLSPFANEKECLFIANRFGLRINNITTVKTGFEYKDIIQALRIIDGIIMEGSSLTFGADKVITLVTAILEHKLSHILSHKKSQKNKPLKLDKYAKQLIDNDTQSKKVVDINYDIVKGDNLRCLTKYFCTDIRFIHILFPNAENVILRSVTKKEMIAILNGVLHFWQNNVESKIMTFRIYVKQCNMNDIDDWNVEDDVNRFEQNGHRMQPYDDNKALLLSKTAQTKVPSVSESNWATMLPKEFEEKQNSSRRNKISYLHGRILVQWEEVRKTCSLADIMRHPTVQLADNTAAAKIKRIITMLRDAEELSASRFKTFAKENEWISQLLATWV